MKDGDHILNCSLCGEPYSSPDPYPDHQICPRCKGEWPGPASGKAGKKGDAKKVRKDRKKAKKAKKDRKKNRRK